MMQSMRSHGSTLSQPTSSGKVRGLTCSSEVADLSTSSTQPFNTDIFHLMQRQLTRMKEIEADLARAIESHSCSLQTVMDDLVGKVHSHEVSFQVDNDDEEEAIVSSHPGLERMIMFDLPDLGCYQSETSETEAVTYSGSPSVRPSAVRRAAEAVARAQKSIEREVREVCDVDAISVHSGVVASAWASLSARLIARYESRDSSSKMSALRCLHSVWRAPVRAPLVSTSSKFFCMRAIVADGMDDTNELGNIEHSWFLLHCLQRLVIRPSSMRRIFWELLGFACLVYDIVTLPLDVFGYDDTDVAKSLRFAVSTFWLCDLMLSFFFGYMENGAAEMRIFKVWKRYLRGWFTLDVTVVTVDWALLMLKTSTSTLALARLVKVGRFLRVMRLLRLARFMHLGQTFMQMSGALLAEVVIAWLNMIGLLVIPVLVSHFVACGWYWLGVELHNGEESWVDYVEFRDQSPFAMYVLCLHWAICQYTPAPHNIHPVTLTERIFTVAALLIGFILFTSFLGSVTSMVTASRVQTMKRLVEETQLRRFIRDHKVSFRLGHQIVCITREHRILNTVLVESDIALFKTLPDSVLVRLHFEVYANHLSQHPLFLQIRKHGEAIFIQLAHYAVRAESYGRFGEIFNYGYPSSAMLFVTHGFVAFERGYKHKRAKAQAQAPIPAVRLNAGSFLCEPALWVEWRHQGYAVSPDWCNLITLPMKELCEAIIFEPHLMGACKDYAIMYVEEVAERCGGEVLYHILHKERERRIPRFDDLGLNVDVVQTLASEAFLDIVEEPLSPTTDNPQINNWFDSLGRMRNTLSLMSGAMTTTFSSAMGSAVGSSVSAPNV